MRSRPSSSRRSRCGSLRTLPRSGYAAGVGVGALLAAAYGFQTAGLELTTVASTGFITGLYVVLTPLLALALFGTPVPRALWAGVVLAVVGLLLLSGVPGGSALGNALVLANAVFQAFQITSMERFAPRYDPRALTFLQMATSFIGFTVIAIALGDLEVPRGATVWGALLVTGIFAGALGYLIATWVQGRTTAARAALVFTLEAPFAALAGVLLADEILGWAGWLGCAVMMVGNPRRGARGCGDAAPARKPDRLSRQSMSAVLLALSSAFLFGATTVAMRVAFRGGALAEGGALFTVLTALAVTLPFALAQGGPVAGVWPFLLAGLLSPGVSQFLFTFAVREAGASRTSVVIGTAPLFSVVIAVVVLDEPLETALAVGAVLIVAGGFLLASERDRPEHVRLLGLGLALTATIVFAVRDNFIRWLAVDTDVTPGVAASATLTAGAAMMAAFVLLGRAPLRRRDARLFAPAGVLFGLSYVCLFEAYYHGLVTVVSPLVATESLWGVALSAVVLGASERVGVRLVAGAALVVCGGVLIGLNY